MTFEEVEDGEDGSIGVVGSPSIESHERLDVSRLTTGCGGHVEEGSNGGHDTSSKGSRSGGKGDGGEGSVGEEELEVSDDDGGLEEKPQQYQLEKMMLERKKGGENVPSSKFEERD